MGTFRKLMMVNLKVIGKEEKEVLFLLSKNSISDKIFSMKTKLKIIKNT